jgi:AcrR family transcriptional regulator
MEAVVRVVADRGLSGLTYRAVAEEAGVTHGLVHYHFGSREHMLAETLAWVGQETIVAMRILPSDAAGEPFAAGLPRVTSREAAEHLFVNELVLEACRRPEMKRFVEPIYDAVFAAVADSLEAAGASATPARVRVIFAALAGLVVQHIFYGDVELSASAAEELRTIIGLLATVDLPTGQ